MTSARATRLPLRALAARSGSTAILVACLVAIAGCAGEEAARDGARPAERADKSFFGLVSEEVFSADAATRTEALRRQRKAGVGLLRQPIDWSQVESAPGRYDFTALDRFVAATARQGVELLPVLFAPPPFRSSAPASGARRGTYPPARPADMGEFAAVLVRRYGPDGEYWVDNRDVPKLPIRQWQVWNEPNLPVYWPSGPDPSAYARLLTATARGIRAADPGAKVVSAGLAESRLGMPFEAFVRGMYEAGAGEAVDSFALHPYARDAESALTAIGRVRGLLEELGGDASIWVTEVGWASGGPRSPYTIGEQEQAREIGRLLAEVADQRRELGIEGIVYFNWKDSLPYAGGRDFFGLHTGLLRRDGSAKPALRAFSAATGSRGD